MRGGKGGADRVAQSQRGSAAMPDGHPAAQSQVANKVIKPGCYVPLSTAALATHITDWGRVRGVHPTAAGIRVTPTEVANCGQAGSSSDVRAVPCSLLGCPCACRFIAQTQRLSTINSLYSRMIRILAAPFPRQAAVRRTGPEGAHAGTCWVTDKQQHPGRCGDARLAMRHAAQAGRTCAPHATCFCTHFIGACHHLSTSACLACLPSRST